MMALIASSNVNGYKLTGFAFGIVSSEMASVIVRHNPLEVWRICPAEAGASGASSASCYNLVENVRVLPIVETEGKFVQVERQVLAADVVVSADHATLEQAPERFNIVGVDVAANINAVAVADDFVRIVGNLPIGRMLIGRQQTHLVGDGFL